MRRIKRAVACLECCRKFNRGKFDQQRAASTCAKREVRLVFHVSYVEAPDEKSTPSCGNRRALTLQSSVPSFGYALEGESWTKNRTVLMHLSLPPGGGPFQDGFGSLGESAEDALNIWNQYLVHMKFAVDRNSILPPGSNSDGDTSVSMSNTVYGEPFGNNVLAVTLINSRSSTMVETDVVFNSAINFDSYRGPSCRPASSGFPPDRAP